MQKTFPKNSGGNLSTETKLDSSRFKEYYIASKKVACCFGVMEMKDLYTPELQVIVPRRNDKDDDRSVVNSIFLAHVRTRENVLKLLDDEIRRKQKHLKH